MVTIVCVSSNLAVSKRTRDRLLGSAANEERKPSFFLARIVSVPRVTMRLTLVGLYSFDSPREITFNDDDDNDTKTYNRSDENPDDSSHANEVINYTVARSSHTHTRTHMKGDTQHVGENRTLVERYTHVT